MKAHDQIFALVDVNNCYVSCERVFNPQLNDVPVIVLSNNDGCVVSRSEEAKNLDIKMAVPFFQVQETIQRYNVQVLSSNYKLYNEMSRRFHNLLREFVSSSEHEVYSIDEGFLNLTAYQHLFDISDYAQQIRQNIWQWIGLPVCVGIGRSKTEAKLANYFAKKNKYMNGVCNLVQMDYCSKESMFQQTDVAEVWGVGRKNTKRLRALNIHSVLDLALADPAYMEKMFSVVMKRTVMELTGVSCIELESTAVSKKQIISSRSFGQRVTDIDSLSEAMSDYLQMAVKSLRKEKSLCGCLIAFAQSSPFSADQPYFSKSVSIAFSIPTDSALQMNQALMKEMPQLFKTGVEFKKCGVILTALERKSGYVHDLLTDTEYIQQHENLQHVLDQVKDKYGNKGLSIGSGQLPERKWSMAHRYLSQDYFSLQGLPCIHL